MLLSLEIRNILLIDHLYLEFIPGLNVLSGETGAGKSVLLDSLGFVLGARGRADLVRTGADEGSVSAAFALPDDHHAWSILEEAGFDDAKDEGTLILRRVNRRDGRKDGFINDQRASAALMRTLGEWLLEIHGQHDDKGLLDPKSHGVFLDRYAGLDLSEIEAAYRARQGALKDYKTAKSAITEAAKEQEYLTHAVGELENFNPEADEDARLDTERRKLKKAQEQAQDLNFLQQALSHEGLAGKMADVLRRMEDVDQATEGAIEAAVTAFAEAFDRIGDAETEIAQYVETIDFDPYSLEQIEERLFALRALARKYQVLPDNLPAELETLKTRLENVEAGEARLAELEQHVETTTRAYFDLAKALSDKRANAAREMDAVIMKELPPLHLDAAKIRTDVVYDTENAGRHGADSVSISVRTNPGAPWGALDKVASGGELSRFLLAMKVALQGENRDRTMIFDEIDRGVGGKTADAVGRRLRRLADNAQILAVTHSPQVASMANRHFRVSKSLHDETTTTFVDQLNSEESRDEIARMISGDTLTKEAQAAAARLLEAADRPDN